MYPNRTEGRLVRLEQFLGRHTCQTCLNRPSRVVTVHPTTDETLSESMPASGCPTCGRGVFREYRLVAEADRDT